jgi:hypothetical protein
MFLHWPGQDILDLRKGGQADVLGPELAGAKEEALHIVRWGNQPGPSTHWCVVEVLLVVDVYDEPGCLYHMLPPSPLAW